MRNAAIRPLSHNQQKGTTAMNKHFRAPYSKTIVITALAAALSACGGGGDSDSGSPGTGASAIDKYIGTLAGACSEFPGITDAATSAALYSRVVLVVGPKTSPTRAPAELKLESYAAADCSGMAKNTVTVAGADTFLQVDGTATIGSDTVDKVTDSSGPFFPGISAATITVNGVRYDGATYGGQTPDVSKDIYLFRGADLYAGNDAAPLNR
jgi:hypothetical protein